MAERGAFTFSSDRGREEIRVEIREVPFAYGPNLIAAIADLVESHEKCNG